MATSNFIGYEEFKALPIEEQKQKMKDYRKLFTVKDLQEHWEIDTYNYYKLLSDLGIKTKNRKPAKKKEETKKEKPGTKINPEYLGKEKLNPVKEESSGIELRLNGTHTGNEIYEKLEKFGLILSDEENTKYDVKVNIKQKS